MYQYPGYAVWGRKQRAPSRDLANFLDWVQTYYVIDENALEVAPRVTPLALPVPVPVGLGARTKPRANKKPPNPRIERCRKCLDFTRAGSNAYADRRTCLDCGHVEVQRKERTADPATCTHPEVDSLGSTKATARLTCTLCGTIVDEQPQEIKRDRARIAEAVKQSTSVDFDLIRNISRTSKDNVPVEVAVAALETFKELVEEEYSSTNTLTVGELHQLLAESLHQNLAAAGVTSSQQPTSSLEAQSSAGSSATSWTRVSNTRPEAGICCDIHGHRESRPRE